VVRCGKIVVFGYSPLSREMDVLKALCFLSSIVTIIVTYRMYILSVLFDRIVSCVALPAP
jgi:hypothetical protein